MSSARGTGKRFVKEILKIDRYDPAEDRYELSAIISWVQPALFTVKEAATYVGRSEQAVQHLIFQRQLPVLRIGRRVH